ncbi:Carboxypeptidase Y inhibitor [Curvularia clavata]|uniref:Carboxypeptidase Y inhibitor n=1 Tax=Curvularia clavata TaxID=95742 RepID=A0A9Q9DSD4_CURCL|nr:Carboxypeptidase Y inhibitor [Curvularia clavata]
MLSVFPTAIVCLLQLCETAIALPVEQKPLLLNGPKNVQHVREQLRHAEIIPTVIDDFLPSLTLSIAWEDAKAKLGNTVKPKHLQKQPTVVLHDDTSPDGKYASSRMSYIITLTDPDAPSRDNPKWSEMCHWIASNASVTQDTFSILPLPEFGLSEHHESTEELTDIMPYKPPGPPPKTGKHRYVFLVFAPKNGTTEPLYPSKPQDRKHWGTGKEGGGVREWATENGLVPVAANFIYAENEKQ